MADISSQVLHHPLDVASAAVGKVVVGWLYTPGREYMIAFALIGL